MQLLVVLKVSQLSYTFCINMTDDVKCLLFITPEAKETCVFVGASKSTLIKDTNRGTPLIKNASSTPVGTANIV